MATISIQSASARPGPRAYQGPAFLSGGFRPFFLFGALWSALAVPLWLAAYMHGYAVGGALPAMVWHAHEMIYGYAVAAVTGFVLTAVPNWTGRLPLAGTPLAALVALWLAGRIAMLASSTIGPVAAATLDLALLPVLIFVVVRELHAGRNFHNLPVAGTLALLFAGNVLVHLHAMGIAYTAALGNRIGVATLVALISLIGGRIVPSFTRNWLAKTRPDVPPPAPHDRVDTVCLLFVVAALVAWLAAPDSETSNALAVAGAIAAALRLARWRGLATVREPLLFVLHVGYAWVPIGLGLLGMNGFFSLLPPGAPLHALTVGGVGTMTLAVMTRASLGHSGRALAAGPGTVLIYALVSLAALLRIAAPIAGDQMAVVTSLAGVSWTAAFGLFAALYAPILIKRKQQ